MTSIGRPVDIRYPTNRAIAALTLLVMVLGVALQPDLELLPRLWWGVRAGLAFFLAWAIARELDPDHDYAAFVGPFVLLPLLFFFDLPGLLLAFWVLLCTRILNRTVGIPANLIDSILLFLLAAWLVWQGQLVVGIATAAAFFLDSQLPQPNGRSRWLALVMVVLLPILFIFRDLLPAIEPLALPWTAVLAVTSLLFLLVVWDSRQLTVVDDATGQPLSPRRVQSAQLLMLGTAVVSALIDGQESVIAFLPLWVTFLGTAVYRIAVLFRRST